MDACCGEGESFVYIYSLPVWTFYTEPYSTSWDSTREHVKENVRAKQLAETYAQNVHPVLGKCLDNDDNEGNWPRMEAK